MCPLDDNFGFLTSCVLEIRTLKSFFSLTQEFKKPFWPKTKDEQLGRDPIKNFPAPHDSMLDFRPSDWPKIPAYSKLRL